MSTMTDTRPEVEFDQHAYPNVYDAYRHEDGSITYIVADDNGDCESPRDYDGNVATIVQSNDRRGDVDDGDELREARDKWNWTDDASFFTYMPKFHDTPINRALWKVGREALIERYIRIFRDDIVYYADRWDAGRDLYGWGYITKEAWDEHMYRKPPEDATDEELLTWVDEEPTTTPKEAFDAELKVYQQWADGEVYGAHHVSIGKPIVVYGEHGAYVDGYDTDEESCWGFLGYDDHKAIASQFTSSPITEVLY